MKQIFKNVYLFESSMGANVYLLNNGDCYDLIDSGIFKGTNEIIMQLEQNGFDLKRLRQIILTHCHCDHIGGAADLVKKSGAAIAAHKGDVSFILQKSIISGTYHNMMVQKQMYMKQYDCVLANVDIILSDGDIIDTLGGLQVIHVPGHTPGSIVLYQPEQKVMFFGDVIRNKQSRGLVIGVPEKFNIDTQQVIKDAGKLLSYQFDYAMFGHGVPILENAKRLLITARTPDEIMASKKARKAHSIDCI